MYDSHAYALPGVCVQDADGGSDPEGGATQQATVSFPQLYDALGRGLTNDRSVLLLYALLYDCQSFQVRDAAGGSFFDGAASHCPVSGIIGLPLNVEAGQNGPQDSVRAVTRLT